MYIFIGLNRSLEHINNLLSLAESRLRQEFHVCVAFRKKKTSVFGFHRFLSLFCLHASQLTVIKLVTLLQSLKTIPVSYNKKKYTGFSRMSVMPNLLCFECIGVK